MDDIDPERLFGIGRRSLLAAGLAMTGAAIPVPGWTREPMFDFPDSAALRRLIQPAIDALGTAVQVEHLGQSANGKPIEMISIGTGERSALIVGAPHPNEPIGCLTIVELVRRLARDPQFRERSGYRWHFIPAIDPDGLDLNAGWLQGPATIANYMRHFFRPAFARQPEYAFPLDMPGYRFEAATPENLCWQRALAIARPDFQSSLHGSDTGGAFYILSENRPGLARQLSRQTKRFGIALNRLGEPDATIKSFAPGVFSAFEVEPYLAEAARAGKDLRQFWGAGRSSTEFAAQTYGSFCMICEVPLWEDSRQFSNRSSAYSEADVVRMQLDQLRKNARLLDRAAPLLARESPDSESQALMLALREAAALSDSQLAAAEAQLKTAETQRRESLADLVQLEPGTTQMRAPAMLARLARRLGEPALAAAAEALTAGYIGEYLRRSSLRPVPVARSIALQIESIILSARQAG